MDVADNAHGPGGAPGPSVLSRAFAILDALGEAGAELTHGEITRSTGFPPATVHRLLAEMVEWGGVERRGRGRYRIGLHLWRLGSLAPAGRDLRDAALPYLQDLFEVTHGVVHLAVLDEDQVLYVERLEARPKMSVVSGVGLRLPLHATGPGKVLLAHASADFADRIISGPLPRHASRTISDPRLLRSALASIRQQGFAVSRDEMTEGTLRLLHRCATTRIGSSPASRWSCRAKSKTSCAWSRRCDSPRSGSPESCVGHAHADARLAGARSDGLAGQRGLSLRSHEAFLQAAFPLSARTAVGCRSSWPRVGRAS